MWSKSDEVIRQNMIFKMAKILRDARIKFNLRNYPVSCRIKFAAYKVGNGQIVEAR
jgi:hypothetical protein